MKKLKLTAALAAAVLLLSACGSSRYCGAPSVQKSQKTINLQRGYGLGLRSSYDLTAAPEESSDTLTEKLRYRTRTYQLWNVSGGGHRYQVEYFAPTKRKEGEIRVWCFTHKEWLDCETANELEQQLCNRYPY